MSAAELTAALACTVLTAASLTVLGVVGRRILLPTWRGTAAVTGGMAIVLSTTVSVGQLLGAVGLINRWAVVSVLVTAAAVVLVVVRRWPRHTAASAARDPVLPIAAPRSSPPATALAMFAVLVVLGVWLARTVIALRRGITDPDSLGYHLPLTHVFASSGFADPSRLQHAYLPVYTYPGNDELVSAMALVVSHSVVFSTVKNLLFALASLVAAHAIGARARASLPAMVSVALVLGLPVAAFTVPGHAKNDAIVVCAVLVGLACLLLAQGEAAPMVLAAGCGGVVIGTKLSSVAAGGALVVWVLVEVYRRGRLCRWRSMVLALVAALITGAPWYVRNLVTFGNPLPLAHLSIGPVRLAFISSPETSRTKSIASFLVKGDYYGGTFFRGLIGAVGPLGLLAFLAGATGLVVGLWSGGWRRRIAGFGLLLAVAYLATPASAYTDLQGRPISYAVTINLHYGFTAAAVCLLALAVSLPPRLTSWTLPVLTVAVTLAGIPVGRAFAFWFTDMGGTGFTVLVMTAAMGAAAIGLRRAGHARWRRAATVSVVMSLLSVASIAGSQPTQATEDPVARVLAAPPRLRIAANVGYLGTIYGPGGRHDVEILARDVDRVPLPFLTCQSFMQAIATRHPDVVAVNVAGEAHDWVAADPALRLEAAGPRSQVYSLIGVPGSQCSPGP